MILPFKSKYNVPPYYVDQSRDFQVLCNLYDLIYNSCKFELDSLNNLNDLLVLNEQYLPLMLDRVGFITLSNFTNSDLRYIIDLFPYIIRWKGTEKAIDMLMALFGKSNNVNFKKVSGGLLPSTDLCPGENLFLADMDYSYKISICKQTNTITIFTNIPIETDLLFLEVLNYIKPAGTIVKFENLVEEN